MLCWLLVGVKNQIADRVPCDRVSSQNFFETIKGAYQYVASMIY